jgi:hypothetical protein
VSKDMKLFELPWKFSFMNSCSVLISTPTLQKLEENMFAYLRIKKNNMRLKHFCYGNKINKIIAKCVLVSDKAQFLTLAEPSPLFTSAV